MQTLNDSVPPFWLEPWHWAAQGWHSRYGVPRHELDRYAARLFYAGWPACFDLSQQWVEPVDERWLTIVHAPLDMVRGVARMLGYLAFLRGGAPVTLASAGAHERWLSRALRYRDANCLRVRLLADPIAPSIAPSTSPSTSPSPAPSINSSLSYACGVMALAAMARADWPAAASRFSMLAAPDELGAFTPLSAAIAPNKHNGAADESNSRPAGPPIPIELTDIGRCLAICTAVIRHCSAESATERSQ